MGQGTHSKSLKAVDLQKYKLKRPQLSEQEILDIKQIFDSLEPDNGYVSLNDIYRLYSQALDRDEIEEKFANMTQVNFEEFFDVMGELMVDKKRRFKDIEFDSNVKNVSCFFCPYPSETNKSDAQVTM